VWHWSKGVKLLERKTQPGAPPAVYGLVWSRFEPDRCALLSSYLQVHG
jgi:microtubule-associated protein-like 6